MRPKTTYLNLGYILCLPETPHSGTPNTPRCSTFFALEQALRTSCCKRHKTLSRIQRPANRFVRIAQAEPRFLIEEADMCSILRTVRVPRRLLCAISAQIAVRNPSSSTRQRVLAGKAFRVATSESLSRLRHSLLFWPRFKDDYCWRFASRSGYIFFTC